MSASTLPILLRSLGLTTLARDFPEAITQAEAGNWGYLRFLHQLAEGEFNERLSRRVERMLKDSALPQGQTLAAIDQAKLPDKARRQLPSLLTGDFVRRGDNLLTFGLPGRGKTLFCAALGRELVQRHQLKILFLPTFKLVNQLLVAKRDLKLPSLLAKLHRFDAITADRKALLDTSRLKNEERVSATEFARTLPQAEPNLLARTRVAATVHDLRSYWAAGVERGRDFALTCLHLLRPSWLVRSTGALEHDAPHQSIANKVELN